MGRALGCALPLMLALAGCAGSGPEACKVHVVADLSLLPGLRTPAVVATLDGQKVVLLIDTGAALSMLSPRAADRFHLYPNLNGRTVMMSGIGGDMLASTTTVHSLYLGHGVARDIELPIGSGPNGSVDGVPILGLFGADFLSNYDVDLDVPGHHFALYKLRDCETTPPFDGQYFQVPFRNQDTKIDVTIRLNDVPIDVALDSGATITTITRDDAAHVGLTSGQMQSDRTATLSGIDANRVEARMHRFGSLEIGAERLRNFRFSVADIRSGETLLGDDFLHFNRVWISYPQQMLFIQPAFGNRIVHRMDEPATTATRATPR